MIDRAALLVACCMAGAASSAGAQVEARSESEARRAAAEAESGSLDAAAATLRRARDGLMAAEEYGSALLPAEELVTTLRSESSTELARDLLQLARIQTALAEIDDAELNYFEAIRLTARAEGEFAITLVDVYHALGRAYIRAARYPEALVALEQARHISQRNLGLFNTEQSALLDDMTVAHISAGDTVAAARLQAERLDNAVRRYGAQDARVIPYRYQLAEYYERSRLLGRAREQYLEIIDTQQALRGAPEASLLMPLRGLAQIDLLLGERATMRDRLAEELDAHPGADPVERALALATLGDWALVREGAAAARDYYRAAYAAAVSAGDAADGEARAAQLFSQPVMIDFIPPLTGVDRGTRSRPYAYGNITLAFSVSADGRPWHVEAVGADPPGLVESAYVRRLRETHFRPRLVAGETVETTRVEYTHQFRYYVAD
jgi:hypothetical protein